MQTRDEQEKRAPGTELRQRAEAQMRNQSADPDAISPDDARRLLHELHIHQIELEMQNEELRRAQVELEASRARYFDLFDLAPVGYLTLSKPGLILEANLTAANLLGVARGALIKQPLTQFILKEDQDIYYLHRKQLFETGEPQMCELRLARKGGGLRPAWAHLQAVTARDSDGALMCRITLSDITERKRAEEALQESNEKYRAIVDTTSDFIMRYDRTGRHLFGNPAALKATGVTLEAYVGKTHRDLGFPEHLCRLWEDRLEKVFCTGKAVSVEFEVELAEGSKDLELMLCPEFAPDGSVNSVVGISRDITERKTMQAKSEEAMLQRNRELALLNSANQTVASKLDLDHVLAVILEEARHLLKADTCRVWLLDPETGEMVCRQSAGAESELVRGWRQASGEGAAGWVAHQGKSLIVQDALTDTRRAISVDQQRGLAVRSVLSVPLWVEQSVIGALTVADTNPDRFTAADLGLVESLAAAASTAIVNAQLYERAQQEIAERKQAEEALRQRTVELQARNEDLDAFAHTVAHDLKNPVGLVMGHAELLTQDCAAAMSDDQQRSLQAIVRNGRKMNSIIDELLLLAEVRKARVGAAPLDMASIVSEAQQRLADMVEQYQAEITVPDASAWPTALGYGPWVEEIWVNYLSNAIKYGGRPPRLELGADTLPNPPPPAGEGQGGGRVRFWVRDHGAGLTPEDQARLFTPFTRLDQVHVKGHGLGLSIVRRIVEKLGGQVGVESQVGQGSVFSFTLPGVPG